MNPAIFLYKSKKSQLKFLKRKSTKEINITMDKYIKNMKRFVLCVGNRILVRKSFRLIIEIGMSLFENSLPKINVWYIAMAYSDF